MNRIVVTGLGAITPIGNDVPSTWQALLEGRSGIGYVTRFDTSAFTDRPIAGEVKDFQPDTLPPKQLRHMDRYTQLACAAALQALNDSGIDISHPLGPECGVVFSASGGYHVIDEQYRVFAEKGPRRVSPFMITHMLPDTSSGAIAVLTGAMGPNIAVTAACATGAASVGEAAEIIRRGDAEVMIAGGAEAPLIPVIYAGFAALRAIATPGDDPSTACKPFDRRRDGFVIAEGAGALILESLEHAQARRARVYAELAGYGSSNDAFDMAASEDSGRGAALAIDMALRKAAIDPTRVGYVNAHGTGTLMNDRVETHALKRAFAKHAYRLAISSTKSMTGHMMGASGAVEAIFSVLALDQQVLPPTAHYEEPDPECDLDYVPQHARLVSNLEAALSTSIGLGGHNAALLFTKAE
ncbi:MAG: beta-ketoacyl-ACP synthase II [Dehalococcoidia bacterium]|nr:beta-ketoacyl-ACP synthase II [Dehalococcoidia bacterium]